MNYLFISYSRKDKRIVDVICDQLKNDGFEVWFDESSIQGGDLWRRKIEDGIKEAKAFILMVSKNSTNSNYVIKELGLAVQSDIPIIPVSVKKIQPSEISNIDLVGIQIINFYSNPLGGYRELKSVVSRIINKESRNQNKEIKKKVTLPNKVIHKKSNESKNVNNKNSTRVFPTYKHEYIHKALTRKGFKLRSKSKRFFCYYYYSKENPSLRFKIQKRIFAIEEKQPESRWKRTNSFLLTRDYKIIQDVIEMI
jgi:hypothetical protein